MATRLELPRAMTATAPAGYLDIEPLAWASRSPALAERERHDARSLMERWSRTEGALTERQWRLAAVLARKAGPAPDAPRRSGYVPVAAPEGRWWFDVSPWRQARRGVQIRVRPSLPDPGAGRQDRPLGEPRPIHRPPGCAPCRHGAVDGLPDRDPRPGWKRVLARADQAMADPAGSPAAPVAPTIYEITKSTPGGRLRFAQQRDIHVACGLVGAAERPGAPRCCCPGRGRTPELGAFPAAAPCRGAAHRPIGLPAPSPVRATPLRRLLCSFGITDRGGLRGRDEMSLLHSCEGKCRDVRPMRVVRGHRAAE